ncbi:MAG TPA: NB-ARC domain-containing protein [Pyrinomonadaceae bacterium]|jgi:hypothetical protein|nr:NB-ARC domain-containing protein [Pyrinomonadaceae bacterium]
MADKIKILFLAAEPTDLGRRRLDEEYHEIDRVLRVGSKRDSFELTPLFALRRDDLQEALLWHKPHIVHFAGHGSEGEIFLMNDDGVSQPVGKEVLARLFDILRDNIRVVVLNACYSKPQAEAISRVIDYTVGINSAIGVESCIGFAAAFYRALAFGRSVEEAVELGKNSLNLERLPDADAPELLLREGVDATKPFLEQKEVLRGDYVAELSAALDTLAARTGTEADAQKVRLAITQGKLILRPEETSEADATSARGRLRITPHASLVQAEADAQTFRDLNEQLYPPPPGIVPQMPGLVFVGRDESLREVIDLIGVGSESPDNSLTVVRGWPGVGKTTLVAVLSRDQAVREAFPDGVLWTSLFFGEHQLTQSALEHKLLSLMAGWGRVLGTDSLLRVPTVGEVTAQLAAMLRNKRMLLIVDDVWHQGHAAPFIQASGSRCAVLATTRLPEVARQLASGHGKVYQLPVLTEEHALRLLRILAPAVVQSHQQECRELLHELEYLPLSIHVAAGLLKAEAELGLDVVDLIAEIRSGAALIQATAPVNRTENGTTPTIAALLRRSTDVLDEEARDCFAFLGAFAPKPATFDLEAMASVWERGDPKPMVRKLASHGLIEYVGDGRYQMHALLVQHANSLLEE